MWMLLWLFTNWLDKFENNLQYLQLDMEKWMLEMCQMLQGQHLHNPPSPSTTSANPSTDTDPTVFKPSPAKCADNRQTPPRWTMVSQDTPKCIPPRELLLDNGDGSTYRVGYTHPGQPGLWQPYFTPHCPPNTYHPPIPIGTPEGLINIFHVGITEWYFKTQVSTELQSLI
jgi:hypothetical protein